MCVNFIKQSKSIIQLTDGSVITTTYLLENVYTKLSIDSRSHKLWRFDLTKNVLELTSMNKRVFNFNKRFNKKNNK
jgi:ribosomal protein L31